jgi:hypothetical protein
VSPVESATHELVEGYRHASHDGAPATTVQVTTAAADAFGEVCTGVCSTRACPSRVSGGIRVPTRVPPVFELQNGPAWLHTLLQTGGNRRVRWAQPQADRVSEVFFPERVRSAEPIARLPMLPHPARLSTSL